MAPRRDGMGGMGGKGGGVERELKFPCPALAAVRERLAELAAEREAPAAFEDNLVFDRDGQLEAAGCLLRLRTDRRGARLTFKGPARFEGGVKLRDERETGVADAGEMQRLLEGLGFGVVQRYQKKREEWRLGGVVVALDHTPIGDFVEFEGAEAEKLADRCGFASSAAEKRSYLDLYRDHRRAHPDAPRQMVFDPE